MRQWKLVALSAAIVSITACGGSGSSGGNLNTGPGNPPPPPPPPATSVTLANQAFNPASLSVSVGSTVTWTWNDCSDSAGYGYGTTCVQHSVVFDDGSGIQSAVQGTGSFTRTFSAAGTFNYHCGIHLAAMTGKIIVS